MLDLSALRPLSAPGPVGAVYLDASSELRPIHAILSKVVPAYQRDGGRSLASARTAHAAPSDVSECPAEAPPQTPRPRSPPTHEAPQEGKRQNRGQEPRRLLNLAHRYAIVYYLPSSRGGRVKHGTCAVNASRPLKPMASESYDVRRVLASHGPLLQ